MSCHMNSRPVSRNPVRWPDAKAALGEVYAREQWRRMKYMLRTTGRRNVLKHVKKLMRGDRDCKFLAKTVQLRHRF